MLVVHPIKVNGFAAFFTCTTVGRATNSITHFKIDCASPYLSEVGPIVVLLVLFYFRFAVESLCLFHHTNEKLIFKIVYVDLLTN